MNKSKRFRWNLFIVITAMAMSIYFLASLLAGSLEAAGHHGTNFRLLFLGASLFILGTFGIFSLDVYERELPFVVSSVSSFGGAILIMVSVITKFANTSLLLNLRFVRITDTMEISAALFLLLSMFLLFRVLNKSRVSENEIAVVDHIAWYPGEVFSLNPLFRHEIIKIEKENWINGTAKLKFKDGAEYEVKFSAVATLEIQIANRKQPFLSGTDNLKENLEKNLKTWLTGVVQRQAQEITLGEFFAAKQFQPVETMIYDLPFTWDGKLSRTISAAGF